MLKNKRIFISGGAGVIGRELVKQLHELGAQIYVGDLKPRPSSWSSEILYRQGDLNYVTVEEISLFHPEVFIHLAATFERSYETYEFWYDNFWHNIRLSNYLMTLFKDSGSLKRVIFASSYLIYNPDLYSFDRPQNHARRLKETDPTKPRNLTGSAKYMHEIELDFLNGFRSQQFSSVCARIFRGYGKGSRCVISRWIRDLLKGRKIQVFRPEGLFDYIYAADTATGLIKLIENPSITGVINLGTDNARRVEDVVNILRKHFPNMEVQFTEENIPFESSQANMEMFHKQTGWIPEIQLEDAIPLIIKHESEIVEQEEFSGKNVLITSISKKIPLIQHVKKAAKKLNNAIKIYGGDSNPSALGVHFIDEFWTMPAIENLTQERLIEYCQENNINGIIPTRDGELLYFTQLKDVLASNNISVMISEPEVITNCIDKLKFYETFRNGKLNIIPTYEDINEVESDRYVIKERYGAGSQFIGLNLNFKEAVNHAKKLKNPIFQPFINGKEVSVDMYIDRNHLIKGVVMRYRDIVVEGESQISTSFYDVNLESLCRDFTSGNHFYGHIILQVIIDDEGHYHIIECNPRFGGASTLSISAGLDTFYWFLLETNNVNIKEYPFIPPKMKRIKQIRYPKDKIVIIDDSGI